MLTIAGFIPCTARAEEKVDLSVTVYQPGGGEPGVPILVRLRGRDGKAIAEARTNPAGLVHIALTSVEFEAAATLEAILDLGAGRKVGVMDTVNTGCNAYEVFLPQFRALQCHGNIERGRQP
ncbi:MAG TPA: hypothetical protein VMH79_10930 [Thermoanaerobaculia bacterium]|nr:hypothetical protein [Thermoanaerobaculia bacterium]